MRSIQWTGYNYEAVKAFVHPLWNRFDWDSVSQNLMIYTRNDSFLIEPTNYIVIEDEFCHISIYTEPCFDAIAPYMPIERTPLKYSPRQIAEHLDLAVLQPNALESEVQAAIDLAKWKGIKSVCVPLVYTRFASKQFDNVSTVIGFPHGNTNTITKVREALSAIDSGTKELDVVINYGRFLCGSEDEVWDELSGIVGVARNVRSGPVLVKAILETCHYSEKHLKRACEICRVCNVDFVKTSTGFGPKGATPSVVTLLLQCLKDSGVQVKASGGIKTYDDASLYLDLGCTRLGVSNYWGVSGESK